MTGQSVPLWFACQACGLDLGQAPSLALAYFNGERESCPNCAKPLEPWDIILDVIRRRGFAHDILSLVGAEATFFTFQLEANEHRELRFSDFGVPNDAEILDIVLSPQSPPGHSGAVFPSRLTQRIPQPGQYEPLSPVLPIWGLSLGDSPPTANLVTGIVTWFRSGTDDEAWRQLAQAFISYSSWSNIACIIPANIAIELPLARLLNDVLRRTASHENVQAFLDEATYSNELNVILPALASYAQAPQLDAKIRGKLNELRKLRNALAHSGKATRPVDQNTAAELLCAALFGFNYIQVVRPLLL